MLPNGDVVSTPDWTTGIVMSLVFAFVFFFVVLPIVVMTVLSLLDVLFRVDIGVSKLLWLGVLLIPGAGLAAYWLMRPTSYQPLLDTGATSFSLSYVEPPRVYAMPSRAAATTARPAIEEEEEVRELPKAA